MLESWLRVRVLLLIVNRIKMIETQEKKVEELMKVHGVRIRERL